LLYSRLEFLAANPLQLALMKQQCAHFSQALIANVYFAKAQEFNRNADLQLSLEEAIVQISEPYLHKIVEELLDNAFKFSATGTLVSIKSVIHANTLKMMVNNQGRTLTHEQIANLGAFMQFDRARYEQQGIGMGLALVQQLVKLHQGKLTIESTETTGTTITVELPIVPNRN
jgi:signal transduction histidine kinase